MPKKFDDALRGYAYAVLKRDGFRCRYCGLDGSTSFDSWLALSWDHLLPKGHRNRDNEDFIVAACNFCNTADNRYLEKLLACGFDFDVRSPEELVELRWSSVERTRKAYRQFWDDKVRGGVGGSSIA